VLDVPLKDGGQTLEREGRWRWHRFSFLQEHSLESGLQSMSLPGKRRGERSGLVASGAQGFRPRPPLHGGESRGARLPNWQRSCAGVHRCREKSDTMRFLENVAGRPLTLGGLLESLRLSEEMSQAVFAKKLGISPLRHRKGQKSCQPRARRASCEDPGPLAAAIRPARPSGTGE
jgi:hypothetical protein